MGKHLTTPMKVVAAVLAVGTLSLGTAEVAGAVAAPMATAPKVGKHFRCAKATKLLTRIERTQAEIKAGLPDLHQAQAKAATHGRTKRANRLAKLISRLDDPALPGKLTKAAQAIENKCHVSAPSTSTTTSATTS